MLSASCAHRRRRRTRVSAVILVLLAWARSASAETRPPPPQDPGEHWVWTTLPALPYHAKIELFDPKQRTPEHDGDWRTLCVAPCGTWIAAGSWLRVNGAFRAGAPFELPIAASVDLAVKPGRAQAGVAILAASGGLLFVSGLVYAFSNMDFGETANPAVRQREKDENRRAFYGVASVGLLGVATGLGLIIAARTTVDVRAVGGSTSIGLSRGLSLSPAGLHF